MTGLRDQLNLARVDLTKCEEASKESQRQVSSLAATLNRVQAQRDEFQLQVASITSLRAQLDSCNNNAAQLRDANATLSNFRNSFTQLESRIGDRNALLQQINILQSEKTTAQDKCGTDLKNLEGAFNTSQQELAACKQSNQAILVTIQNLRGNDNQVNELRSQLTALTQKEA